MVNRKGLPSTDEEIAMLTLDQSNGLISKAK